jgi:hypothetical protein
MGSLSVNELNEIVILCDENLSEYKIFVETGTYHGETILNLENHFDISYTIELSEDLYNRFNSNEFDRKKIVSILGDSSKVLKDVLKIIENNTIFFLDGHYSSCGTAKGDKDVPLIEELLSINELFHNKSIVIIDDYRLFNTNLSEDWTGITLDSVRNTIKNRIEKEFIVNDRLIFKIN